MSQMITLSAKGKSKLSKANNYFVNILLLKGILTVDIIHKFYRYVKCGERTHSFIVVNDIILSILKCDTKV